jgi:hypothetical protein
MLIPLICNRCVVGPLLCSVERREGVLPVGERRCPLTFVCDRGDDFGPDFGKGDDFGLISFSF